jgi:cytochrome c peroxidase
MLMLLFSAFVLAQTSLTPMEELGKKLFFDENLSTPPGQSCATCHAPEVGFTGPVSQTNLETAVYPGAVHTRFGNRKPPTAAYGGDSPIMFYDAGEGLFIGGMFWDGRATGWTLGDPLAEQAQGPFLNPLEQNNPGKKQVILEVAKSNYANLFEEVWGEGSLDYLVNIDATYERIARSISAYEKSVEVNPFTSKYDYYLKGEVKLTKEEKKGLKLFEGKAMCSACHISEHGPNGEPPLFTDFTYDNLGVPKNPDNPFYMMPSQWNPDGANWVDPGLGGFLQGTEYAELAAENYGKHKVPTLRNVDKRPYPEFIKSYGHNGFFKSLEEITHFYNTRDVEPWPAPEVADNVNTSELGDLGLTAKEEARIVAFMRTLSDGYVLPAAPVNSGGAALAVIGPNPFNPGTRFSYTLPNAADIRLEVYNIVGQKVATLASGQHAAGEYQVEFNARDLASGIYLVRLQNEQTIMTQKVTLVK